MASEVERSGNDSVAALSVAEVREYLRRHADFLTENADLLAVLTPPTRRRGDRVVDMQRVMVERLQAENARLTSYQSELISASRSNLASQGQIHAAALALIRAHGLAALVNVVGAEFPGLLELDVAVLCVEREGLLSGTMAKAGATVVAREVIAARLGQERDIVLRSSIENDRDLYGDEAPRVRSDALLKLRLGDGDGACMLALGAAEGDRFHPGQGTELLGFLGKVLEHCFGPWMSKAA